MARRSRVNGWCQSFLCFVFFVAVSSLFCHCTERARNQTSKSSVKLKRHGMLSQQSPSKGDSSSAGLHDGRLIIGRGPLEGPANNPLEDDSDYQSDPEEPVHIKGQVYGPSPDSAAVQQLLQTEPKVTCTPESMKLMVHEAGSTPGNLYIDRGRLLEPLALSQLPTSCGYSLTSARRHLILVAPYDGCFVTQEEDNYVLPLQWCGLPVRMACPAARPSNAPVVSCRAEGMVVTTDWIVSVNDIKVNLNGQWEPLLTVSSTCGFSVVTHSEGVVITARYAPCVQMKDGMFTLGLSGDGQINVSCPPPSKPTQSPVESPNQQDPNEGGSPSYPWSQHPDPPTPAPPQDPKTPIPGGQEPVYPQYPGPGVPDHPPQTWGPEDGNPQHPYYPYPYEPDSLPLPPDEKPATPAPDTHAPLVPEQQPQPIYPYPFDPQQPTYETAPYPPGQGQGPFPYPYPYPLPVYPPSEPIGPEKPAQDPQPPVTIPGGQVHEPFNHFFDFWPGAGPGSEHGWQVPFNPGSEGQPEGSEIEDPSDRSDLSDPLPENTSPDGDAQPGPLYEDFAPPPAPPEDTPGDKDQEQPPSYQCPYWTPAEPPVDPSPDSQVDGPVDPTYFYPEPPKYPGSWYPILDPNAPGGQPPLPGTDSSPNLPSAETQPPVADPTQPPVADPAPPFPQSGVAYNSPVLCPENCRSGFSYCCPSISYHQHYHHFVPSDTGTNTSTDTGVKSALKNSKDLFEAYLSQIAETQPSDQPERKPVALPASYPVKLTPEPEPPGQPYVWPGGSQYPQWLYGPQPARWWENLQPSDSGLPTSENSDSSETQKPMKRYRKSSKHEHTVDSNSQPNDYVLLDHGPPGGNHPTTSPNSPALPQKSSFSPSHTSLKPELPESSKDDQRPSTHSGLSPSAPAQDYGQPSQTQDSEAHHQRVRKKADIEAFIQRRGGRYLFMGNKS